mmetsp:Transcript_36123/g.77911  ORF Transcript_36123/g.77911 Transcript_36123/m.77911 type:complete len:246 (+) Transcript_36123:263-1000(+)
MRSLMPSLRIMTRVHLNVIVQQQPRPKRDARNAVSRDDRRRLRIGHPPPLEFLVELRDVVVHPLPVHRERDSLVRHGPLPDVRERNVLDQHGVGQELQPLVAAVEAHRLAVQFAPVERRRPKQIVERVRCRSGVRLNPTGNPRSGIVGFFHESFVRIRNGRVRSLLGGDAADDFRHGEVGLFASGQCDVGRESLEDCDFVFVSLLFDDGAGRCRCFFGSFDGVYLFGSVFGGGECEEGEWSGAQI